MSQLSQVVDMLRVSGGRFPSELAESSGIPKASVYAVLSDLKRRQQIVGDGKVGYSLVEEGAKKKSVVRLVPPPTAKPAQPTPPLSADITKVLRALLNDEPDWAPYPRALLEEVAVVRGVAMTAVLEHLLDAKAIEYIENAGYQLHDLAIARKMAGVEERAADDEDEDDEPWVPPTPPPPSKAAVVDKEEPEEQEEPEHNAHMLHLGAQLEAAAAQMDKTRLEPLLPPDTTPEEEKLIAQYETLPPLSTNNPGNTPTLPVAAVKPPLRFRFALRDDGQLTVRDSEEDEVVLVLKPADTRRLQHFLAAFETVED